jgi:hypothetical protein
VLHGLVHHGLGIRGVGAQACRVNPPAHAGEQPFEVRFAQNAVPYVPRGRIRCRGRCVGHAVGREQWHGPGLWLGVQRLWLALQGCSLAQGLATIGSRSTAKARNRHLKLGVLLASTCPILLGVLRLTVAVALISGQKRVHLWLGE